MRKHRIFLFLLTLVAAATIAGCAQDVPPINCQVPDFNCYQVQALRGITVVRENIGYWSNVNLCAQIAIALSGLVATIVIALQDSANRKWTRPIGLVATALVTGMTSALVASGTSAKQVRNKMV